MTSESRHHGFTIVELMVTLAVAAILMGFALPAFNAFVTQRNIASAANDFVLAVTYARSEAIRRGSRVSVQAGDNDSDNEWGLGYCVVIGDPGDCGDADTVLRRFDALDPGILTFNTTGGLNNQYTLRFNARGMLENAVPGVIELCHDDEDPGRTVQISASGKPNVAERECNG